MKYQFEGDKDLAARFADIVQNADKKCLVIQGISAMVPGEDTGFGIVHEADKMAIAVAGFTIPVETETEERMEEIWKEGSENPEVLIIKASDIEQLYDALQYAKRVMSDMTNKN